MLYINIVTINDIIVAHPGAVAKVIAAQKRLGQAIAKEIQIEDEIADVGLAEIHKASQDYDAYLENKNKK